MSCRNFFPLILFLFSISDFALGSGGFSVTTISLRSSGFEAYNEVTREELEKTLGADRPLEVWEKYFSPISLADTYEQALELEKEGNFKAALVYSNGSMTPGKTKAIGSVRLPIHHSFTAKHKTGSSFILPPV
jgi:hypothetical protein